MDKLIITKNEDNTFNVQYAPGEKWTSIGVNSIRLIWAASIQMVKTGQSPIEAQSSEIQTQIKDVHEDKYVPAGPVNTGILCPNCFKDKLIATELKEAHCPSCKQQFTLTGPMSVKYK